MPWRVDRRPFARPVWRRHELLVIDLRVAGEWVVLGLVREWRRREQLPARPVEDDQAIEFLRTRPERRQLLRVVADRRGIGDQAKRSQVMRRRRIGALDQLQVVRKGVIGFECRAGGRDALPPGVRRSRTTVRTCRWAPTWTVGCGTDTHLARRSSCSFRTPRCRRRRRAAARRCMPVRWRSRRRRDRTRRDGEQALPAAGVALRGQPAYEPREGACTITHVSPHLHA